MTTAEKVMKSVNDYFEDIMNEHPEITRSQLLANGAIHYMNGNDGTDFDWNCNERVCEFYIFHANEWGYIKVFVFKDGSMEGYVYLDEGHAPAIHTQKRKLNPEDVRKFAEILFQEADKQGIWDETVDKINFSAPSHSSLLDYEDDCDEEDCDEEDAD